MHQSYKETLKITSREREVCKLASHAELKEVAVAALTDALQEVSSTDDGLSAEELARKHHFIGYIFHHLILRKEDLGGKFTDMSNRHKWDLTTAADSSEGHWESLKSQYIDNPSSMVASASSKDASPNNKVVSASSKDAPKEMIEESETDELGGSSAIFVTNCSSLSTSTSSSIFTSASTTGGKKKKK